MIVYQVIEGYYFIGEKQETFFGTYSTKKKANERKRKLIEADKVNEAQTFIKEIELDKDIEE
jgi:hypothetical protein